MKYIKKYRIIGIAVFILFAFIKPIFCLLLFGLLVLYFCIYLVLFLNRLQTKGIKYNGKVISYEPNSEGDKIPVVEFTNMEGECIRDQPFIQTSTNLTMITSFRKKINQPVTILCDPDDPKKFMIANEKDFNYFVISIFILISLAFIIFSICALLGYVKT